MRNRRHSEGVLRIAPFLPGSKGKTRVSMTLLCHYVFSYQTNGFTLRPATSGTRERSARIREGAGQQWLPGGSQSPGT